MRVARNDLFAQTNDANKEVDQTNNMVTITVREDQGAN